jgi:hypothetical protein
LTEMLYQHVYNGGLVIGPGCGRLEHLLHVQGGGLHHRDMRAGQDHAASPRAQQGTPRAAFRLCRPARWAIHIGLPLSPCLMEPPSTPRGLSLCVCECVCVCVCVRISWFRKSRSAAKNAAHCILTLLTCMVRNSLACFMIGLPLSSCLTHPPSLGLCVCVCVCVCVFVVCHGASTRAQQGTSNPAFRLW